MWTVCWVDDDGNERLDRFNYRDDVLSFFREHIHDDDDKVDFLDSSLVFPPDAECDPEELFEELSDEEDEDEDD